MAQLASRASAAAQEAIPYVSGAFSLANLAAAIAQYANWIAAILGLIAGIYTMWSVKRKRKEDAEAAERRKRLDEQEQARLEQEHLWVWEEHQARMKKLAEGNE